MIEASLVAFIDILGFGRRAKAVTSRQELDLLIRDVKKIHLYFERTTHEDIVGGIDAAKKEVLAFSDSVIVSLPMNSPVAHVDGLLDLFMSELEGLAIAQGACVTEGIFLRGGIDMGGWYHQGDVLVSPALVGAYGQENITDVPVLALTARLHEFLRTRPDLSSYSDPSSALAILQEHRGKNFYFVDYIRASLRGVHWVDRPERQVEYGTALPGFKAEVMAGGYLQSQRRWLEKHKREIVAAHSASLGEKKVRDKYEWLALYHNEVVHEMDGSFSDLLITDRDT